MTGSHLVALVRAAVRFSLTESWSKEARRTRRGPLRDQGADPQHLMVPRHLHHNRSYIWQIAADHAIIGTDPVKRQIRREVETQSYGPLAKRGGRAAEGRVRQWDHPDSSRVGANLASK